MALLGYSFSEDIMPTSHKKNKTQLDVAMLSLCSQNKGGGGGEGAESILASSLLFFPLWK